MPTTEQHNAWSAIAAERQAASDSGRSDLDAAKRRIEDGNGTRNDAELVDNVTAAKAATKRQARQDATARLATGDALLREGCTLSAAAVEERAADEETVNGTAPILTTLPKRYGIGPMLARPTDMMARRLSGADLLREARAAAGRAVSIGQRAGSTLDWTDTRDEVASAVVIAALDEQGRPPLRSSQPDYLALARSEANRADHEATNAAQLAADPAVVAAIARGESARKARTADDGIAPLVDALAAAGRPLTKREAGYAAHLASGLSGPERAEVEGRSLGAVKVALSKGRAALATRWPDGSALMADLAVAAPVANRLALDAAARHRGCDPADLLALESLARERADLERSTSARPEGNVWDAIAGIPADTERIVSGHDARMARRERMVRLATAARIAARPKRDGQLAPASGRPQWEAPYLRLNARGRHAGVGYAPNPAAATPTYPPLPAGSYAHFVASLRRAASTSSH